MAELTPERLAEIRKHYGSFEWPEDGYDGRSGMTDAASEFSDHVEELLSHIDALTAENERLRDFARPIRSIAWRYDGSLETDGEELKRIANEMEKDDA